MAEIKFERALSTVCSTFKISCLDAHQLTAIKEFARGSSDVFVTMPTGCRKSHIYQALPSIFDILAATPGHVVVVVSPLLNLI